MTACAHIRRWLSREDGGVLVEFSIVIALFLFIFFAMLDFGRLVYQTTLSEKATYIAARTAIVRPAACAGLPERHVAGTVPGGTTPPRYGTSCSVAGFVCQAVADVTCVGNAGNATAVEIWARIAPMLPPDASIDNLRFTYRFDQNLGFLGGPYTPMVTVDLDLPDFQFVSPLGALAVAAGAPSSTMSPTAAFADFSVTLPAEDLNSGENG